MKLRQMIESRIKDAIKEYDFDYYLEKELDNINVDALIEAKIEQHLDNIDFEEILTQAIDDIFEDEFDEYEISEIIKESLED